MRIFVSGVAGFLGSHLADALLEQGHQVVGVDDLSGGYISNVPKDCEFHIFDLTKEPPMDFMAGVELVYHCAAAAYEGLSVFSPGYIAKNIYSGSTNVFSAAAAMGVKRVVFMSSMARYGNGTPPFNEDDPALPVDPYGLAKVGAERMLQMLAEIHGFEWVILVPHNIYGPRQKYDDPYRNVASIMINRLLQGKAPIIYGNGEQKRCFSYVDDIIPAIIKAGFNPDVVGEIINIGPDRGEVSINELAYQLGVLVTGQQIVPIYELDRPREVKVATCSAEKAKNLLDMHCTTPLVDGMIELVRYIKSQGPLPFDYRFNIEIQNGKTPRTWVQKLI